MSSLNAKTVKSTFKSVPPMEAGPYPARIVGVVDMGLQPQFYEKEEKAPAREIALTYEFSDEFMLDADGQVQKDKPRWLSEMFPLHNIKNEKAKSTQRYKAVDPTDTHGGDFAAAINTPITVTLAVNPNNYNKVMGVAPMRSKDVEKCPPLVNKPFVFDLADPDMEVFLKLPKWIQERIKTNLQYNGSKLQALIDSGNTVPGKEPTPSVSKEVDDSNPY